MAVLVRDRDGRGRAAAATDHEKGGAHPSGDALSESQRGIVTRQEWRWCLGAAALVMALTCLPYLWLQSMTPAGMQFLGFPVGPDDQCVYLAWMRQAADGHFLLRSLWTNDPQQGINTHLLFWLLGLLSRVTSLSLPVVYHIGRVLLGGAVLLLFYRFAAFFTTNVVARRTSLALAALSAGFGWLYPVPFPGGLVDSWQAEAITFQSLYTNALFCGGLALMLGTFCALLAAEQSGRRQWALVAGVAGGALANIHSYDVFTVVAVWIGYLLVRTITSRRVPVRSIVDALLAAAVALPAVGYQLYVYTHETVFRERADLSLTRSPLWWQYLLGYGLLIPLALWGGRFLRRQERRPGDGDPSWLLIVWAVLGFLLPYLPFSFQRKLVMGLHLPLALLAGIGLVALATLLARKAPQRFAATARFAVIALVIALTMPTNVTKMLSVLRQAVSANLSENNLHPVFWAQSEITALQWADQNLAGDGVFQAFPVTAALIPPFTGRRVWAGHWSETPAFPEKLTELMGFFGSPMAPEARLQFLRGRGITYLVFGPRERAWDHARSGKVEEQLQRAEYLAPIYTAGDGALATTIYALREAQQ